MLLLSEQHAVRTLDIVFPDPAQEEIRAKLIELINVLRL